MKDENLRHRLLRDRWTAWKRSPSVCYLGCQPHQFARTPVYAPRLDRARRSRPTLSPEAEHALLNSFCQPCHVYLPAHHHPLSLQPRQTGRLCGQSRPVSATSALSSVFSDPHQDACLENQIPRILACPHLNDKEGALNHELQYLIRCCMGIQTPHPATRFEPSDAPSGPEQWQAEKPDLYVKRVYKQPGLDT